MRLRTASVYTKIEQMTIKMTKNKMGIMIWRIPWPMEVMEEADSMEKP